MDTAAMFERSMYESRLEEMSSRDAFPSYKQAL
jgi:hypothetical protein